MARRIVTLLTVVSTFVVATASQCDEDLFCAFVPAFCQDDGGGEGGGGTSETAAEPEPDRDGT